MLRKIERTYLILIDTVSLAQKVSFLVCGRLPVRKNFFLIFRMRFEIVTFAVFGGLLQAVEQII